MRDSRDERGRDGKPLALAALDVATYDELAMGTFRYPIEVGDPEGQQYERLEAMVDTGASYTVVPASMLGQMRVTPHDRLTFFLADGRQVERDVGRTWIRVDGKAEITLVVFGDEGAEPLLGAYTLEGLRLGVDSFNRRLVPIPGYLMCFYGKGSPDAGKAHFQ